MKKACIICTAARDGGWIEALHYYSGQDSRLKDAWTLWNRSEAAWQNQKPSKYPSFEEWAQEVRSLALPDESKAPDASAALVPRYIEGEAFAYWVRAVVESARRIPSSIAKSIEERCPGFLGERTVHARTPGTTEFASWLWRELLGWIEAHALAEVGHSSHIEELRATARNHLRAERIAAYWVECDAAWSKQPPRVYPDFEEWLHAADHFVTR